MNRIVCIGNRLVEQDAAGPAVFDHLTSTDLPADVEVIDGGLGGLDLLRFVEGARRVVFVDSLEGNEESVEVLDPMELAAQASERFDHAAGLPYLLRCLDKVCEGPLPEIAVVGVALLREHSAVERAAALALSLAREAA